MSYSPKNNIDNASLVNDGDRKQVATSDDQTQNLLLEVLQELKEIKEALKE